VNAYVSTEIKIEVGNLQKSMAFVGDLTRQGTTLAANSGDLSWKHGHVALCSRIQTITDPVVQFLLYSQLVLNVFL